MRVLALVTEAFGGRGGIARYNRSLLRAVASHPEVERVLALPRIVRDRGEPVPAGIESRDRAAGGKARYGVELARTLVGDRGWGLVLCGHLNLLPFGRAAARASKAPLWVPLHGIEAWGPRNRASRPFLSRVDRYLAVSEHTRRRFLAWSGVPGERVTVLPNCLDAEGLAPGPKPGPLLDRYGLRDRTVLLTVARLAAEERYKGHDEVLAALPALAGAIPDVAYLVVGEGEDRPRLEARARGLGVADRVVFAGYVPESEKADHYRLADVFVMPGRGEGFGIVYLEALACGVPVVASAADASGEVVEGVPGAFVVDPARPDELVAAVREALAREGAVTCPERYAYPAFERAVHRLLDGAAAPGA